MIIDKKKPIVVLAIDFPPLVGGISRYIYNLVNNLPDEEIRVICLPAAECEDFDRKQNFSIKRLNLPKHWDPLHRHLKFLAPAYLFRLLQEQEISLILCGQAHYSVLLPAWIVSKIRRIEYGVFAYGFDLLHPQTRSYRKIFNALLRGAGFVFVDSNEAANISLKLGVKAEKIHVVFPSVDTSPTTVGITSDIVKQRHALGDKKCILMVGRLVERKGCDIVIQALPTVLKSVPEVHFLIVGKGPMQAELEALVEKLKLEKFVTFAGFIPDEELVAYYQASDVFVMVSRELSESGNIEGFGIVYLEANLQGKPVVAGRSGGVPEAVLHEETGLLVDPNDPEEVALAIIRILKDTAFAQFLGENGRRRVLNDFTIKKAAKSVQSAIRIK